MPPEVSSAASPTATTPKDFWTYQAASETPPPPPGVSKEEWESLSPGMRREIGNRRTNNYA
jgi:hypothetical protein